MLLVFSVVGFAGAQTATTNSVGTVADAASVSTVIPWMDIVHNGGFLMYVLGAMSFLTITFVLYFFIVLRVPQIAPDNLRDDLIEKIKTGDLDDVQRTCERRRTPLSAVVLSAVNYIRNTNGNSPELLKDVMEGEGQRQSEAIQGQTQYLLDIAAVSPMIGLLGTVFGMLRAFSSVALDMASAKPVNLAAGVSQALITTAFGLIVSIPAMMFYAYFRRRATKLVARLEVSSTHVLSALLAETEQSDDVAV
jgi:biopolymer transport protein ExbB